MRIAVVHSFYSTAQPSGENRVVVEQVGALREAGHDVHLVARRTDDDEKETGYRLRTAARVATGSGRSPLEELRAIEPEIVHVHNLFPNYGSRWISQWSGPVVVSLHNFRTRCSNGLFFRDGAMCTRCPDLSDVEAVRYGCYRESRVATLPVALGRRQAATDLLDHTSGIVTTSEAFDRVLKRHAGRPLVTTIIPNFGGGDPQAPLAAADRSGWLAMGRLSTEKGFTELVREWPSGSDLVIIGSGPERNAIEGAIGHGRVEVRNSLPIDQLRAILPGFKGLIFPSRWLEAAPQVVVEAARVGLPVIAHEANGVAEIVTSAGSGAVYADSNSLEEAISRVEEDLDEFSNASMRMFEDRWLKASWVTRIERFYASLT